MRVSCEKLSGTNVESKNEAAHFTFLLLAMAHAQSGWVEAPKSRGAHEIHVLTMNGMPTKVSPRR